MFTHLIWFSSTAIAPNFNSVVVNVEVPFVHEVDILPEVVGRVAVKALGDEGRFLQIARG